MYNICVLLNLILDKKALKESESESEESPEPSDDDDSFINDGSDEETTPVKVFTFIFS